MQLNSQTVTILHASSSLPPVVITGWPEGIRLLRPKALNKVEQLLLQDALDKSLVSMVCLQGKDEQAFLMNNDCLSGGGNTKELDEPESTADANEDRDEIDDIEGKGIPSGVAVWAGPLAKQASQLF
jgi:hypothetical protein